MKDAIQNHLKGSYDGFFRGYVQKVKKLNGAEFIGLCPFHKDNNPSFNFNGDTGQYKCHGCGETGDVFTFYAKTHDLNPKSDFQKVLSQMAAEIGLNNDARGTPRGKIVKTYDYRDEAGTLLFQVCRMEPKDFRQRRPDGSGKWKWSLNGTRRVLYNLPEVLKAERVLVVEGEKDADNLKGLGFIATTSPMGAGKWLPEYSQSLRGKDVVLLPDNDHQGRDHMIKAAESLNGTAKSLKWLDLPGVPEKGDASDWLAKFADKEEAAERLSIMIENAAAYKAKQTTDGLSPLTPEQTSISEFVRTEPQQIEYVFEDILPKGVVGAIVGMGGVSKSFLEITLGIGLATGKPVLKHFKPVGPTKVLGLFAEDPDQELHRRLFFTVNHTFPELEPEARDLLIENLHVKSVMGQVGPLMHLDQGNPARSRYFDWLHKSIEAHKELDVLILDPKSRFYGLAENDNDHNTQWVACLEDLSNEFGLTILFSHHTSKASGGALLQTSARGGSALVDACRWVANLRTMDEQTAKKYDLDEYRNFVEFDVSKSNYAPRLPGTIYFRRGDHGVLVPVNLEFNRLKDMAEELCTILADMQKNGTSLTRRELVQRPEGKEVTARLRDRFSKVSRADLNDAIEYAEKEGWLSSQTLTGKTNSKGVLWVER